VGTKRTGKVSYQFEVFSRLYYEHWQVF